MFVYTYNNHKIYCMKTNKMSLFLVTAAFSLSSWATVAQEKTVTVGGAPMYPSKNIIENAVASKDHTTLVAAVKAAGLVETLSGKGPFTVFAPTNDAFNEVPKEALANLMKPENKQMLSSVLTYHVVPGMVDATTLMNNIKEGKGKATLKSVQGEMLTFTMSNGKIWIVDAKGGKSMITIKDVFQSNGVIHVIDKVLMP